MEKGGANLRHHCILQGAVLAPSCIIFTIIVVIVVSGYHKELLPVLQKYYTAYSSREELVETFIAFH